MRVTIERLRVLLVASAAVLVLIVASFLAVAHFRAHRFLHDLPARLGADIERETNGWTYSQSGAGGRTIFTIHAARAVERHDGKVVLHNVRMVLYGQEQKRVDRIYGKEFEYDQKAGVVRATGEVQLDLQAPAPVGAAAQRAAANGEMRSPEESAADPGLVHVRTSGLVYLQKLGVASTTKEIEFTYHGFSGSAVGATYNADSGMTTLEQRVQMAGVRDGRPMQLRAAYGEMNQKSGQLMLREAHYSGAGAGSGKAEAGQEISAGLAHGVLRTDGTLERVEGSDGVTLESGGGILRGARGVVAMTAAGRPETAHLMEHVTYRAERPLQERTGSAAEMMAHFDAKGQADSVTMSGGAELGGRERRTVTDAWSERALRALRVTVRLAASGSGGRRVLENGVADGDAHLVLRDAGAKGGVERSEVSAEHLTASFAPSGRSARVTRAEGEGHTVLDRSRGDGVTDRSTGDRLEVTFAAGGAVAPRGGGAATRIESAVQRGAVVMRHTARRRDGTTETVDAGAEEADYDGASDRLSLIGNATMREAERAVRADRIELDHGSGDAEARGRVQVSTVQGEGGAATHVVAQTAEFAKAAGTATFRGGAGDKGLARAWQAGSQVEAPTLIFTQKDGVLDAFGAVGTPAVRTVLSEASGEATAKKPGGAGSRREGGVARVTSERLHYSDAARRAEFTGGVQLTDGEGSMHAVEATAYLLPAAKGGAEQRTAASAGAVLPAGQLDRVIASGGVVVRQPGREGTGEQLVYMAADDLFTLTGTAGAPPTVTDAVNGTVRGTQIRFHSGDNSVIVSGDPALGARGRVRSETRIKTD